MSTKEKHSTVRFINHIYALNSQVGLSGKVGAFSFQFVEHYMKAMVRAPLVPKKLYYFFKMETFISCHEF